MRWQQRIPIQDWYFASNDEGFGQCNIVSPAEFTADSYLIRNYLEFPKPLYFGRETGLNFGGHGAVCSPMDRGDSESTNCKSFLSGFSCLIQSCEVVILAKVNCFLVLSFHLFLFELLRFVILLG
jgi:hypothetical protein